MSKVKNMRFVMPTGEVVSIPCKETPLAEVGKTTCECFCTYYNICRHIRDPRFPDDMTRQFPDLCADFNKEAVLESGDHPYDYMPLPGSLEVALKDDDMIQQLIKKEHYVKLDDVISGACSGWCSHFREDRANCNASNSFCLLRGVFIKSEAEVLEAENKAIEKAKEDTDTKEDSEESTND